MGFKECFLLYSQKSEYEKSRIDRLFSYTGQLQVTTLSLCLLSISGDTALP
jgi:hypothetical protein